MSLVNISRDNENVNIGMPIASLLHLFLSHPDNDYDGTGNTMARITDKDKFADWFVDMLNNHAKDEAGTPIWGQMIDDVFELCLQGYEDCSEFVHYWEDNK